MRMRISTLMMNQDIHTSSRHYEASGYDLDLDFAKPLRTNRMSHILGEVG